MNPRTSISTLCCGISLMALVACGGSDHPSSVATLTYADPTTGTYRLVKNTALSSSTHLVLDVMGVGGPSGTGIAFTFTVDPKRAVWGKVTGVDPGYIQNGTVLSLGSSPLALKSDIAAGTLIGAVGQKGLGGSVALDGVLARVALDLKAGAALGAAALGNPKAQILQADGTISAVSITPGVLSVN